MKRASIWTRDTMTKWGMQNARLEAWGPFGRGWSLKGFTAQVVEPQFIPVIAYPKAWSPPTKGAVTGEEQGLYGSTHYVKRHLGEIKDGKLSKGADYDKISAYYNLDNGTGKIRGVYLQGNALIKPIFETWLAPFNDLGAKTLTLAETGSTDHIPFDEIGIPGFQFIQDKVEYESRTHHTSQDNFDRIQADDLKQASTIMAAFVYQTAMMDGKLPRKPLK